MTVITEFDAGNISIKDAIFSIISGSTLPSSGSIAMCPAFLITKATATTQFRLRLYATSNILNATNSDVLGEKARQFGSVTGSASDVPVFEDLIIDILSDTPGIQNLNPPLFGGPGQDVYYYLQDYPVTTASGVTDNSGSVDVQYTQLAVDTGSAIISQSLYVPVGSGGVSGSFITPEIYAIFSGSIVYVTGSDGSSWVNYSRLRIYQDEASMNAPGEIDRPFASSITASYQYITGADIQPFSGSGLIVDIYFSGSLSGSLFPINIGANMYTVPTSQSWYRYEPGSSPVTLEGQAQFSLLTVGLK